MSSKTIPQHGAATLVLHSWDGVIWIESLTLFPPLMALIIVAKQFYLSDLTRAPSSERLCLCPGDLLQTSLLPFYALELGLL